MSYVTKLKATSTGTPTGKLIWEVAFPQDVDPRYPALYNNVFYAALGKSLSALGWEFTKLVNAINGGADPDDIEKMYADLASKYGLDD
eukprot:COSAG01_NODE_12837_length_1678_cov_1.441419_2_plen_88_part_00